MKYVRHSSSIVLFVTAMLTLVGCSQGNNPGGKLWFYTHSTGNKEELDTSLTPACFIELSADGHYTSDFGHFDYGTWIYADSQVLLSSHLNTKSILAVNYLTATEMQVGPPKGPFTNFERQAGNTGSHAEDPFSVENNSWRIKATAKETDEQLSKRLVNHCRFWERYFSWALNNRIDYIDVRSTPTPIKIYGNGFGLKPYEALPKTWTALFFDAEDCRKANEKIKKVFDSNSIAWPHTDNKYKMFLSAFQQLERQLK